MGLDIRLPIGALFTAFGAILTLYGIFGDPGERSHSLGWNINLWWGLVLLVFGVVFLVAGRRARRPEV